MNVEASRLLAALLGLSLLGLAPPALADFVLGADERSLHADFNDPFFSTSVDRAPPTDFVAWTDQLDAGGAYSADQESRVTSLLMTGSGEASGWHEMGSANSTFQIVFSVTTPTEYSLTGSLGIMFNEFNRSRVELTQGATTLFEMELDGNGLQSGAAFADSGVLASGQYTLLVESSWTNAFETGGEASYDFRFAVVPEPGTAALMGFGCVLLAATRRSVRG